MYFKENIIKNKIELHVHNTEISDKELLHIAYGTDSNFLFGAAISATSVLINNQNHSFHFHFFVESVDDDIISRFKRMSEKFQTSITIYIIDNTPLEKLPTKNWPYSSYYRLIAFDYIGTYTEKLLYLDADVVCKGNINELITLSLDKHIFAVVPDIKEMHSKAIKRLNEPDLDGVYFNSGVILANIKKWNENNLTSKTISFILENKNLKYPDQDALNILLIKNTYLLPQKFNCIYSIKSELSDRNHQNYKYIIKEDSILIHYVGTTKPWNKWGEYPSTIYFTNAHSQSTWHDVSLADAITPIQWKKKSKHEFRRKHFINAIASRIKYYLIK